MHALPIRQRGTTSGLFGRFARKAGVVATTVFALSGG
jgi:hypothetical protein